MQTVARTAGQREGVEVVTHLTDGDTMDAVVSFVCKQKIDLLIIGLHRRLNRMSSLWSTVYTIAQNVPCSVLGVH
jgi:nucleotide-binding universal stress UspA family protein